MKLPEDVKKYVRGYIIKVIVMCAISLAISVLVCLLLNHAQMNRVDRYILYALIVILPIAFIIIKKVLTQLSWRGEITRLEYENIVESEQPFSPVKESLYNRNTLYGYVKFKNGTVKMKKIYSGRLNESRRLDDYKVGDEVIHIFGMEFCQVISKDFIQCGICGARNIDDGDGAWDHCECCEYHFVK